MSMNTPYPAQLRPEQMQRYLPFRLYNELILNPSSEALERCVEYLRGLLQTAQTYCSAPILEEAKPDPDSVRGRWREATLLFADISGFTAMSEELAKRGRAGAEEIARIVNRYFEAMVDVLYQNGGFLLKFGGDALLGMFVGQPQVTARYAVQAALDMQREMFPFTDIDTSAGRFRLQMKVGVHTGKVFTAHVGTPSQMEYWVTGEDVNLTALAEEAAWGGEVVASESTKRYLTAWSSLTPIPSEDPNGLPLYVLPMTEGYEPLDPRPVLREVSIPQEMPELIERLDTLTTYLPKGLLPRLVYNPHSRRAEGEHRLVAVLFSNVVGFSKLATELAAASVPEQAEVLTETMQDYFTTMQSIIEEYGGTVNKTDLYLTGDKLLAVFGAPVAHEDDLDQAARAALTMQAALEEVNQRLATRCPNVNVRLRQRMGLSTGYVFSGNVGAETRQEYTIMGDEVNLAARLMSAADWDAIWSSSHVFYWLEPFGSFKSVETLAVKGKREPVPVYQLESMGETQRPRPPLADREQELTTLQGCLDQLLADQHQGQIILLTGEAGIGKSRLWAELRPVANSQGILWLTGRCYEQGVSYHLLADILRDHLRLAATDDAATQRQVLVQQTKELFGPDRAEEIAPFLAIMMNLPLPEEWEERVEFLGEHLSARLAQETKVFFEQLTEDQPVILLCEDLHWVDKGSVEVLLELMKLVEYVPIMLGFTLRPGQYAAYERIAGVAMTRLKHWYKEVPLEPLSAQHSAQIASAVSGQTLSAEQRERICQRSGGNPLLVVEITRTTLTAPNVPIPDTVDKIIESRVDALPAEPRQTIKAAAVTGVQFSLPELVFALGKRERDVRRNLAELRRMQLIDIREKTYTFIHSVVQEAIYSGQNLQDRRTFHRRLAAYWAQRNNPQKSAPHYHAGGLWDQALEQGERAADQQRERYANQEAIRLYEKALEDAEESRNTAAQSRLYHKLGEVHYLLGNHDQAIRAYQHELGYLLIRSPDTLAQAEIHCALGRVYDRWGRLDQALGELNQGLALIGSRPNPIRAQLLLARCSVLIKTGELAEARQNGLEGLQITEDLGARSEEAYACTILGAVYGGQGEFEDALVFHQRSLDIARELGDLYKVGQALTNIGTALSYLKRWSEAEACYQEALEIQNRIGDRFGEALTLQDLAWLYLERGQLQAARCTFSKALKRCKEIDDRIGIALALGGIGKLYQNQERWDEAREQLRQSADLCEEVGAYAFLPEIYEALAQVYLGLGQPQDALAAAQNAWEWAQRNQDRRQEATAHRALSEVYLFSDDLPRAEHHAQRSLDLAREDPPLLDQAQAATDLLEKIHPPSEPAIESRQIPDLPRIDRVKLRRMLVARLDIGDLRDLCFDLRVDYQDLPGEGKRDKARELIAYLELRGRILDLLEVAKQLRPDVPWEDTLVGGRETE